MNSTDQLKTALDEVFRRIGRNVFVFEQIELLLKTLLNDGRFEGAASELKKLLAERDKKPDKRMLGQLIDPLIDHHLTPADTDASLPGNSEEARFSFKVTFNHTAEERAAFKKELEVIVAERNDLIHTLLLRYRFDTPGGCSKASEDLEQQWVRVTPVRDRLRAMVRVMEDMKPDMVRALAEMKRQLVEGEKENG